MTARDSDLIERALRDRAALLRRLALRRSAIGPQHAAYRANLRAEASDCSLLADRIAAASRLARAILGYCPDHETCTPADHPELASPASCGHPRNDDGECGCAWWPERAPIGAAR